MSKFSKLQTLYAKIPSIVCIGLCHPSCSIVPAAKIEIKRARKRLGGKNPFNPMRTLGAIEVGETKIPSCGALKDKRCSIYSARPAICRLYGVAEGLECSFGCVPKKKLTKQEAHDLIREIEAL